MMVVRYADAIVVGFEHRSEAERFLHEWTDRLRLFGLELHPDKTRLSEFGRHAAEQRTGRGEGKPGTFNVLGVTHVCGTTRKSGRVIVKRQTIRKRLSRQVESPEGGTAASLARASRAGRAVVAFSRERLAPLLRDPRPHG